MALRLSGMSFLMSWWMRGQRGESVLYARAWTNCTTTPN